MSQDHLITLVDKATSEYLIQTDWTVNMQICDTLNREGNPMLCREVVRHATKRMKEKKSRVSMLALELLETLVKNCEVTHSFVGGNEVQAEIIKLIQNKKTKEPVKERALELVQYWADSFSSRRDLPQFNQTFMLLRRAGIPFPPRRKDEPPLVFKNAPAASAAPQRSSTQIPSNNRSESGSNLKGDLGSVQENVNLAMEMLAYTNPEEEDPAANEILKELIATCKEAMPNVRSTIESANFSSDAQMVSMLALNDELVKVQEMYEDLLARRQLFVTHGPQKKAAPQNDILDLATAFGTLNTQAPPLNPPTYQTATTTPSRPLDEFDFLSGPAPPQQNITPTKATPYPPLPAQSQPVNPFFDSSAPAKPSGGDLDEFDLFARGRHSTSTPPPAMSSPLQPSKQVQSTSLYFPPSTTSPTPMYSNTSSNPYNLTPAITTTASNPYNITPAANPYNSAPLATSPNNQLYGNNNAVPRATSPYNMNTAIAPTTNPYNSAPLATSPANQLYGNNNAVPRATSPYNNPQAYGLNPTSSGGAVGAPFQSSYPQGNYGQQSLQPMQPMQSMQPMQPMQSMQPMQPLQPSYNSNPYGQPMGQNPYSLPAGGYRPQ